VHAMAAASQSSATSSSSAPASRGIDKSCRVWYYEDHDGQRLARAMSEDGIASLNRWCKAWEPQVHGGSCAAASAMSALRFLGMARGWSQQRIWDEVLHPNGLVTQGIRFLHGFEMCRLLGGRVLDVRERSSNDEFELDRRLREDLSDAFSNGSDMCILVNYLRQVCPIGFSGGGHWSPLGGFAEDKVLIMDTNSKKHPPHWVCIEELWRAMCQHNPTTGGPRGYVTLRMA